MEFLALNLHNLAEFYSYERKKYEAGWFFSESIRNLGLRKLPSNEE